jgi:hypothetical protein
MLVRPLVGHHLLFIWDFGPHVIIFMNVCFVITANHLLLNKVFALKQKTVHLSIGCIICVLLHNTAKQMFTC